MLSTTLLPAHVVQMFYIFGTNFVDNQQPRIYIIPQQIVKHELLKWFFSSDLSESIDPLYSSSSRMMPKLYGRHETTTKPKPRAKKNSLSKPQRISVDSLWCPKQVLVLVFSLRKKNSICLLSWREYKNFFYSIFTKER